MSETRSAAPPALYADSSVTLERREADAGCIVYVLTMHHGTENRLDVAHCGSLAAALDAAERDVGIMRIAEEHSSTRTGLVLCSGIQKYFSLGLDLQSYYAAGGDGDGAGNGISRAVGLELIGAENDHSAVSKSGKPLPKTGSAQRAFEKHFLHVVRKLLLLPMYTVAAIDGHVIAGGLVLALAADRRLMTGRPRGGLVQMNEVHLPSSVPAAMSALVAARCTSVLAATSVLVLGSRMDASGALSAGLIDAIVPGDKSVLHSAIEEVQARGLDAARAPFVAVIKRVLHADVAAALGRAEAFDHFSYAAAIRSKL